MYVRRNRKKRKDGTERVEVMLAHNVRVESSAGTAVTKPIVMARLGNEDDIDDDMVDSMIAALERYKAKRRAEFAREGKAEMPVEQAEAVKRRVAPRPPMLRVLASKQLGARLVIERVWKDLGLQRLFLDLEQARCRSVPFERVVLATVVNRLVDPVSKLACNDWVRDQGYFPEAEADDWKVDHYYRSLDVIEDRIDDIGAHVARTVLDDLSEPERARLMADTTTIFSEAVVDDEQRAEIRQQWREHEFGGGEKPFDPFPQVVNDPPLLMRGKSKDHRGDAPQVVVGLVTTMTGAPVWHATAPGNTSDKAATRTLVTATAEHLPDHEVTWTSDSGMAGKKNLRWLAEQGAGWLCGVPVRPTKMVADLLDMPGAWTELEREAPEGRWTFRCMDVPEGERAHPDRPERLIAVCNPSRARRDNRKLDASIARVEQEIAKDPSPSPRTGRARVLSSPALARLTRWVDGKLELDEAAVAKERHLAGVKVLRTTDMDSPVEAMLSGYDDLLKLEKDFRTFKSPLRVRPMYHRSAHRIRAHVMVCFLALVCQHELERRSGKTWAQLRKGLDQIHAVRMGHGKARWWQHSELSESAWAALQACGVESMEPRWVTSDLPVIRWSA